MTDQINNELLKLQDELSKFEGSVLQIVKSNELADNLINSSKQLQENFAAMSEKIQALFSDYMNKTYSFTEKNISKLYAQFQERTKHEDTTLDQLTKLTLQNETLSQEFLQKVTENSKNNIENISQQTLEVLNEEKDYINLQITNYQNSVNKLIEEHTNRLKSEQEVLDNYLELAKETSVLSEKIKAVDFPGRFTDISAQVDDLKAKLNAFDKKVDDLSTTTNKTISNTQILIDEPIHKKTNASVEKIATDPRIQQILDKLAIADKKAAAARTWAFIIFLVMVLSVSFMVFVLFNLYPNFFDNILSKF